MEYVAAAISIIVILIFLIYFVKLFFKRKTKLKNNNLQNQNQTEFAKCPICKSNLTSQQNVFSKIFQSVASQNDKLCYVYGCSNCYPKCKEYITRTCPVCKKTLNQEQYLLSRIFYKTKSGKPHVIINGCVNCNRHANK